MLLLLPLGEQLATSQMEAESTHARTHAAFVMLESESVVMQMPSANVVVGRRSTTSIGDIPRS